MLRIRSFDWEFFLLRLCIGFRSLDSMVLVNNSFSKGSLSFLTDLEEFQCKFRACYSELKL
jgi:hypothetical protein